MSAAAARPRPPCAGERSPTFTPYSTRCRSWCADTSSARPEVARAAHRAKLLQHRELFHCDGQCHTKEAAEGVREQAAGVARPRAPRPPASRPRHQGGGGGSGRPGGVTTREWRAWRSALETAWASARRAVSAARRLREDEQVAVGQWCHGEARDAVAVVRNLRASRPADGVDTKPSLPALPSIEALHRSQAHAAEEVARLQACLQAERALQSELQREMQSARARLRQTLAELASGDYLDEIGEVRQFQKPPRGVCLVVEACVALLSGKIPARKVSYSDLVVELETDLTDDELDPAEFILQRCLRFELPFDDTHAKLMPKLHARYYCAPVRAHSASTTAISCGLALCS
jgi:hypothetical protein